MGATRLLNQTGDVTVGWTEDQDATMAEVIQSKMDQGIRFFIVAPYGDERTQIQRLSDIRGRQVVIGDADIEKLFADGKVGLFTKIMGGINTIRRTLDAREAARSHTVAVRQPSGG